MTRNMLYRRRFPTFYFCIYPALALEMRTFLLCVFVLILTRFMASPISVCSFGTFRRVKNEEAFFLFCFVLFTFLAPPPFSYAWFSGGRWVSFPTTEA